MSEAHEKRSEAEQLNHKKYLKEGVSQGGPYMRPRAPRAIRYYIRFSFFARFFEQRAEKRKTFRNLQVTYSI